MDFNRYAYEKGDFTRETGKIEVSRGEIENIIQHCTAKVMIPFHESFEVNTKVAVDAYRDKLAFVVSKLEAML